MENQEIILYGKIIKVFNVETIISKLTQEVLTKQDIVMQYTGKYTNLITFSVLKHNIGRVKIGDWAIAAISIEAIQSLKNDNYFNRICAYKITPINTYQKL